MTYIYDTSKFSRVQDELLVLMMQSHTEDGQPAFMRGLKMISPDAEGMAKLDKAVLAALSVMIEGEARAAHPGQIQDALEIDPDRG